MSMVANWTDAGEQASLQWNFAAASLLVVAGVLTAWVWVKSSTEPLLVSSWNNEVDVALPETSSPSGATLLLQQADGAMAAGRVVAPRFDNALYFYQAVLAENPADPDARDGVTDVRNWVIAQTRAALVEDDWARAGGLVDVLDDLPAALVGADAGDAELVRRVRTVNDLLAQAEQGLAAGAALDGEQGPLRLFGRVLQIDPGNTLALGGLDRVAVEALVQAQEALVRADMNAVDRGLAVARAADPQAPGLARVTASAAAWQRMQSAERLEQRLAEARAALAEDRLVDGEDSAWALFSGVLASRPDDADASAGLDATRRAFIQRGWQALERDDLAAAASVVQRSEGLGATVAAAELQQELAFRQRLADARAGRFDEVKSVGSLQTTRREAPEYPRGARNRGLEGWTELEFTVTETGAVQDVVVASSSSDQFHSVSIDALQGWRFEPWREDGRAMPVRAAVRFTFQL